eukprot:11158505-Lingulodinium_polyedra.AAC.1
MPGCKQSESARSTFIRMSTCKILCAMSQTGYRRSLIAKAAACHVEVLRSANSETCLGFRKGRSCSQR